MMDKPYMTIKEKATINFKKIPLNNFDKKFKKNRPKCFGNYKKLPCCQTCPTKNLRACYRLKNRKEMVDGFKKILDG